ncbi:PRC-barrel domain-containing protein [Pseudooceanicola sp. MF1-13]|uniref:PRC-barrel domain-containing protein n=1 Tax=Pseudooceanicola sp. MF1-13 TaxID=3379095 RepID=UPI0038926403
MSNVKTLLMTGVAVLSLAAPVTAQSIGSDAGVSIGADASAGDSGTSASADASAATGTTLNGGGANMAADSQAEIGTDADLTTDLAQDDAVTTPTDTTVNVAGNVDAFDSQTSMTVGSLIGADVASAAGESIGEIDDVVDMNGETMAVVGVGGFLGLGEHDVALPVTELMYEGNTILAMGYTREQLKSMAEFNAEMATSLESTQTVELGNS